MRIKCKEDFIDPHGTMLFRKGVWYDEIDSFQTGNQQFVELMAEILNMPFIVYEDEMEKYFHTVDEVRELEINEIINEIKM
jgi:hypothetical protein